MLDIATVQVRDLDYAQVKQLRKAGLDPAFTTLDTTKSAELIDWIIERVYADLDFKGVAFYKVADLAYKTYRQAMGGPEEIKN